MAGSSVMDYYYACKQCRKVIFFKKIFYSSYRTVLQVLYGFFLPFSFIISNVGDVIANAQSAGIADNSIPFMKPAVNNLSSGLMYVIIRRSNCCLIFLLLIFLCFYSLLRV
jgi:hypothetical protein